MRDDAAAELAARLADRLGIPEADAEQLLDELRDAVLAGARE